MKPDSAMNFLLLLLPTLCHAYILDSPVKCHGQPATSQVKEFAQSTNNSTYQLSFHTAVNMELQLGEQSCFQVNLEPGLTNETEQIDAMFYVIKYEDYYQSFPVRRSYKFGIPEFQSSCRCDCPESDEFCGYAYDKKYCARGDVCIQKFHPNMNSHGCQHRGGANLCCDISVRAFENRKFTAVSLNVPTALAKIKISIYVHFKDQWKVIREYYRTIHTSQRSNLYLNGQENVVEMYLNANAPKPTLDLETFDKEYYYEDTADQFGLKESPVATNIRKFSDLNFRFLQFTRGQHWKVHNAIERIHHMHQAIVTNCKAQTYTDRYDSNGLPFFMIRNSTGYLNQRFRPGKTLDEEYHQYIQKIDKGPYDSNGVPPYVDVYHTRNSAPLLDVRMEINQKIKVTPHREQSYFQDFNAELRLDKDLNRYLNISLINAHGMFSINVYRDKTFLDVSLTVTTQFPLAANFTEILALPPHIEEPRWVCVHPVFLARNSRCKLIPFRKDRVEWFQLPRTFIESEGKCPGCNVATSEGSFLSFLNPRNWFNGIGSVSEGFALALEVVVYVIILIVAIAIFRKVLWPCLRWALCSPSPSFAKSKPDTRNFETFPKRFKDADEL